MEFKVDVLGWWERRKARKLAEERERLARSRAIYRGQALRLQGRSDENFRDASSKAGADTDKG